MFKKLTTILKSKDEKELASAEEHFDELMGRVDEDQQDLSKLEHHMREEWDKISQEVKGVEKDVDEVLKDEVA